MNRKVSSILNRIARLNQKELEEVFIVVTRMLYGGEPPKEGALITANPGPRKPSSGAMMELD